MQRRAPPSLRSPLHQHRPFNDASEVRCVSRESCVGTRVAAGPHITLWYVYPQNTSYVCAKGFAGHVICRSCVDKVIDVGNERCPTGCNPERKISSWIPLELSLKVPEYDNDHLHAIEKSVIPIPYDHLDCANPHIHIDDALSSMPCNPTCNEPMKAFASVSTTSSRGSRINKG